MDLAIEGPLYLITEIRKEGLQTSHVLMMLQLAAQKRPPRLSDKSLLTLPSNHRVPVCHLTPIFPHHLLLHAMGYLSRIFVCQPGADAAYESRW